MKFRSLSPNGVLLYATDDMKYPSQFLSVELVNGHIIYRFTTGQGIVYVQSKNNSYGTRGVMDKVLSFSSFSFQFLNLVVVVQCCFNRQT